MDKKETAQVLTILKVAFPTMYKDFKGDFDDVIIVWNEALSDYPLEVVKLAVNHIISTSKFPPVIADVVERINKVTKKPELTEVEAWGYIKNALRNSLYNAQEEWEKLPEAVRSAVTPELLKDWAMLGFEEVDTVIQSNFMRSYKVKAKTREELQVLPPQFAKQTLALAEKFSMN